MYIQVYCSTKYSPWRLLSCSCLERFLADLLLHLVGVLEVGHNEVEKGGVEQ